MKRRLPKPLAGQDTGVTPTGEKSTCGSINTNIASLDAQNYLTSDKDNFQTQTINEVTSGLRIVNSGDDAAGLAIPNELRCAPAFRTQGSKKAHDGLASLQTIDGGVNISPL